MRIGIDARLPAYRRGGISQYILQLIPALAAVDQENEYIIFHSRKEDGIYFAEDNGNFQRATAFTPCHHRFEKFTLGLEVWRHRLDLLHSPDFIPTTIGVPRRVITVHDLNFIYYPQYLTAESRRYYLDQIKWAVAKADHILADCEHTRQDLIERLSVATDKVTTVPLAVNPLYEQKIQEAAIKAILKKWQLPAQFILFVGTLEPRKNLPTLIKAYARLRQQEKFAGPLILIGGKGWLYDEVFQTIADLKLGDYVRHLENVPDQDLAAIYASALLLAQPSHYEGFGFPPLEAMQCGCPVISSNRASLPEVVGNAGILLDPDDIPAWVDGMAKVLMDSKCRQSLIKKGYQQAAKFSWETTAKKTLAVYKGMDNR